MKNQFKTAHSYIFPVLEVGFTHSNFGLVCHVVEHTWLLFLWDGLEETGP
jgi:hypothetical protein